MSTSAISTEDRIRRLEDREAIKDLVTMYGFVMDERSISGIRKLFADDAEFRTPDGYINTSSLDELVAMYEGRFDVNGPTNHFVHGHVVRFDPGNADLAYGLVSSHVEVSRKGVPLIGAIRYADTYVRTQAGWRFKARVMSYMYYVDVHEYPEAIHVAERVRIYGDDRLGDWPVVLTANPDLEWLDMFLS